MLRALQSSPRLAVEPKEPLEATCPSHTLETGGAGASATAAIVRLANHERCLLNRISLNLPWLCLSPSGGDGGVADQGNDHREDVLL